MAAYRVLALVLLCTPAQPLSRSTPLPRSMRYSSPSALSSPVVLRRTHSSTKNARRTEAPIMFGGPTGGFLNLGAPEVVVIGAVAWALLGPKELYRLAREAGSFLGEWQQLGRQAQSTFTDAIEREMAEDAAKDGSSSVSSNLGSMTSKLREEANSALDTIRDSMAPLEEYAAPPPPRKEVPPLNEYMARASAAEPGQAAAQPPPPLEPPPELLGQLEASLGNPAENRATFLQQISGDVNRRVLEDGGAAPPSVQSADEDLIETQIQEAENQLATLRAEAQVIALRRAQSEANAERARQREEAMAEQQAAELRAKAEEAALSDGSRSA
uniref:Uncharacterized protein n=1 Tax=Coccolithus braarudii TaxID=221442 RepID=A0A7S0PXQ3_9EUKA